MAEGPLPELPIAVVDCGVGGLTVLHECLVSLPHELGHGGGGRRPAQASRRPCRGGGGGRTRVPARRPGDAQGPCRPAGHSRDGGERRLRPRARGRAPRGHARVGRRAGGRAPIQAGGEIDALVVDCIERVCAPLRAAAVDTVILGCIHDPLVRPILERTLGRGVEIVTSGVAIAEEVERELRARGLDRPGSRRRSYRFRRSGDPEAFRRLGTRFLQLPLGGWATSTSPLPGATTRTRRRCPAG